ncbi:MAG TPA: hypothetical protein VFH06_03770 [Candidatus Saccharimonadales bacterium]|nr:hypothetical protein [Candidatus Saccharimonadales bacterium]
MPKSTEGAAESSSFEFHQEHETRSVKVYPHDGRVIVEVHHGDETLAVEVSTRAVQTMITGMDDSLNDVRSSYGDSSELYWDYMKDGKLYLTATRRKDGRRTWLGVLLSEASGTAFFAALVAAARALGA